MLATQCRATRVRAKIVFKQIKGYFVVVNLAFTKTRAGKLLTRSHLCHLLLAPFVFPG